MTTAPATPALASAKLIDPQALMTIRSLEELPALAGDRQIFICGGAEVYAQALPWCSDLYLTLVKRHVEGDTFFPPFEDRFELVAEIEDGPEFKILHFRNTRLQPSEP